jgi:hypothetical protein
MTELRLAEGYVPTWDIDAEVGRQGELLTLDLIDALRNGASVEVKTDEKFTETGNAYFEYQCNYPGRGWEPSGLAIVQTELWVHVLGIGGGFLVLKVAALKVAARRLRDAGFKKACTHGSHPTRGVCAPLLVFLVYYREAQADMAGEVAA